MRKYAKACTLFAAAMAVFLYICAWFNGLTFTLENGKHVPADISAHQYALTGLSYDVEKHGYPINLNTSCVTQPLALIFTTRSMRVYQNDSLIYDYSTESPYSRITIIPINHDSQSDWIHLLLAYTPTTDGIPSLFRNASENMPKVILGTMDMVQRFSQLASDMTMVFVGIYAMVAFSSMVLFLRKPTERYLLFLAAVACINLITTLITTGISIINISYSLYLRARPLLFIIPVTLNATTCLHIFADSIPSALKRALSPIVIFTIAAIAIVIQSTTELVTYHLVRRLLWIPSLIAFANAIHSKRRNSTSLLIAYAASEAVALYLYDSTLTGSTGAFSVYVRLTELSNMLFLVSCLVLTYDRFAGKFREAEALFMEISLLNTQLEEKVAERTSQLKSQQEQKHNMMLNIFHDLRSPIFITRQRLQQLTPSDEESKESLCVIAERLHYMEVLTEELFLSAKLESNGILFDEDSVALNDLLLRVVRNHKLSAMQNNVEITYTETGPMQTWGDAYRLEQAFQNLIINAIVHTPPGGKISISLESIGDNCLISFADTGSGISPEDIPKVFERYYRINHRDNKSSGLGLSIAKEIVTAHRGSIAVHSTIEKGSVFVVTLPLVK